MSRWERVRVGEVGNQETKTERQIGKVKTANKNKTLEDTILTVGV